MAFTGDLENLHIVDIIQLIHTTRKSGIFFVKGSKGESKLVFRNGYIVGANHINDSVRIGTVLVKTGAITIDELKQTMGALKNTDTDRIPLLAALVRMGTLTQEDALRGLHKLVVMTIVELMSWTRGTFTFDGDAIIASAGGEQDLEVDAQMVLMDALRIFDERERDRADGKEVPSFEAHYADVLPAEYSVGAQEADPTVTADDLGLADIDRLEKKIRRPSSEMEIFDPIEIHRRKTKELLAGFSFEEQDAFASFLRKSMDRKDASGNATKQAGKAVVLFSCDKLIRHSVMSLCKDEGVPVFTTDDEKDLDRIVAQCLSTMRIPVIVIDSPANSDDGFPEAKIISLRNRLRGKYGAAPVLQLASPRETNFILQSYHDGVRAVLPKPLKEVRRESYVQDTISFLDAFKSYIKAFQELSDDTEVYVKKLKDSVISLRRLTDLADAPLVILAAVAQTFERAVTFFVRPTELIGERAIGLNAETNRWPTRVGGLKIPLSQPSVFRDAIAKGQASYGESGDEALQDLYREIGKPRSPAVVLLPVICDRKVVAIIYGDFGAKEASPVQLDILEVLAQQVGITLEYEYFRRQSKGAAQ